MLYFTLALTLGYDIDRFEVVESSIDKTGDSRGRIHELRQFQHHWQRIFLNSGHTYKETLQQNWAMNRVQFSKLRLILRTTDKVDF
jgi:hypothetical protein